ncbi:MAG: trigger factor [Bacteroidetes bacterium GWF2_42_66]|nr:MAG: trigger factor [Bacteroidetes bacterium GWA2_42_15]OFY01972.1 MAG: trigger factor [Bacteroidetes bacterium GWE2_42_39]OFY44974.1 MAG: trigger factor [Bacteroidetes bacterium GWF2_42_66]HBL76073.1 trigger factor [Prolixibacteraceae bacterium]HCR90210.1 trigger factor [Prolixibacteraceae bacterium]
MNITRENIGELNAIINVSIEKSDYEATVNDVLRDYRKKANMPGFRPGKVPAGLIKKMYGKAILVDEVNKLLSNNLSKYIVDEKLNILGDPLPNEEKQEEIDWDTAENFNFVFDIGIAPEIEVKLDKRSKYPYYAITADSDTIQKQIDAYTGRFGENIPVETVEENDTIRGNFIQLDADGNELEGGIKAEKVVIAVDLMKDNAVQNEFIGKKNDDVIVFDPVKTFESKHEVGHMLNISHEEAEKIEGNFKFTIIEILRFKKAELNEELFKKVLGDDTEVKTEEEFKASIKSDIEDSLKYSSDYKFAIDTRDMLVEKTKMELPDDFLKRWLVATNKELTKEQIDNDYDHFIVDLKWQLIKDKLIKENEVVIKEEDLNAMAKEMAKMQFRQYGMNNVPDEYLENYAGQILSKEEDKRRVFNKVQEDKLLDVIKSKVNVDIREVSQEEFNKLLEK